MLLLYRLRTLLICAAGIAIALCVTYSKDLTALGIKIATPLFSSITTQSATLADVTDTRSINHHDSALPSSSDTLPVSTHTFIFASTCPYTSSCKPAKDMLATALKKPLHALIPSLPSILPLDNTRSSFNNTFRALEIHNNDDRFSCPENKILNHRHLIELNKVKNPLKTVSVSSYNILSRHYLWEQVYSYLPNDYTDWNKRFERLNQSFADLSKLSDIMCFQEMEYQVYRDYWKSYLGSMNYDSVFQKKPKPGYWKKSTNMMDGVSIFYNRNKFELINYETINFAHHFKNSTIIEQTADTETRLNIRNTVAVIAVLKHKLTKELIFVSNTHLYWNPKHDDVRLMQVLLLTNLIKKSVMRICKISEVELNEQIKNRKGPNIIMVGDFNSNPTSMVYKFLSKGKVHKRDEPKFTQDYGPKVNELIINKLGIFKSPYKDLYSQGIFTKTTYTKNFKDVIDYMWFADSNEKFKFTKVLGDIDADYLKNYIGFPNPDFPSDHLPILSEFEFD